MGLGLGLGFDVLLAAPVARGHGASHRGDDQLIYLCGIGVRVRVRVRRGRGKGRSSPPV